MTLEEAYMPAGTLKPHPLNPHGVLVPCAHCGREIHCPRADFTGRDPLNPQNLTCSYDCMRAYRKESR